MDIVTRIFGIDLRTQAVFRICLGAVILADLVNKAGYLTAFYTDHGVMTRAEAIAYNHPARISFYFISGLPVVISVLFAIAGLLAILLIVGYRTRLVTFFSWIFFISLNNRNLIVQQGGDQLLAALTFWAIFLPLGSRWSIDAALAPDEQPRSQNDYFSVGTIAILLQVLYVYFIGALLKDSPIWMPNGQAVYYALHLESFATPLAHWLRQFDFLLQALTYYVWTLELVAPLLVFSPIWHLPLRLFGMMLLVTLHIGFFLFLEIGLFPFVSITSLTLLTPGEVWDWLAKRVYTPEKRAIKIYYDKNCSFCLKTARIFRTFCLPPDVSILPAQDNPTIRPIFEAEDSWVVTDAEGRNRTKWRAVSFVLRQSPIFWIFGRICQLRPFARFGDRLYRFIGNNRSGALGRLSARFLPYRRQWLHLTLIEKFTLGALALMIFAHNITTLNKIEYELPDSLVTIQKGLGLSQTWNMFAPNPAKADGWLVIRGVLEDGTVIDLWHRTPGEPDAKKPQYVSEWYPDYRWRKYISRIVRDSYLRQLRNFARYYCRTYNVFEPGSVRLASFTIDYHREWTQPGYLPRKRKLIRLLNWRCID